MYKHNYNIRKNLFNKIKEIFEPMIDFRRVSASVMGKKYYLLATKEQRVEFIEIFKDSLLDTYAETLEGPRGLSLSFVHRCVSSTAMVVGAAGTYINTYIYIIY